MPEVTEKKVISESDLDSFIRTLKEVSLTQNAYELHKAVDEFSGKYRLSEDTRDNLIGISNRMLVISRLKIALSRSWIITQRNMGVIGFTLFFAVFSVIGINVLAFGLALALDTGIKGQKILRTIFFLPNVLSMIIVALIWSMLFVQLLPAITGIEKWISDSSKTPWLLVLVAVWQGCGYYMIVYLAGLQNIPKDYYEAIWLIPPLVASVFFMFIYNIFAVFEYYYEKSSFLMIASTVGGVLNIILNYFFIKKFGTEQYLTIAQEALRMVREDIKNPPADIPPADIAGKLKNAQMASGSSPAARANFQAPILTKAQKTSEAPQMASSKERRDILMRSGGVADELPDDSIDIEDIKSPREKMKSLVVTGVVILSMLLMTLLIIFGIIPLIKQIEAGASARDKIEYLEGEFYKNRYDPEVSAIMSAYESSYGTVWTKNPLEEETTTETTTEATTTTTEETQLTAYIVETTTSEETSEEETTYEGED